MVKRTKLYQDVLNKISRKEKLLAVLIDPEKMAIEKAGNFIHKVNLSSATHIFVGGSTVDETATDLLVSEIKKHTKLPVFLFPGDVTQLTDKADALLFLSLYLEETQTI